MWLVVGLGNPGTQYQYNRHNIGFMAVDALHSHFAFGPFRKKYQAELSEGILPASSDKIILLKPQTYMNLSGASVQAAAQFYKINPDHVVVFHDDLDLPSFSIKTKIGGGAGGHNGLKSIDEHLGKDYIRVRLGIGHPDPRAPDKSEIVSNYVLSNFARSEAAHLDQLINELARAFPLLVKESANNYVKAVMAVMKPENGKDQR